MPVSSRARAKYRISIACSSSLDISNLNRSFRRARVGVCVFLFVGSSDNYRGPFLDLTN
jgi:hypothetical protein